MLYILDVTLKFSGTVYTYFIMPSFKDVFQFAGIIYLFSYIINSTKFYACYGDLITYGYIVLFVG
jgi:hypothetical protein